MTLPSAHGGSGVLPAGVVIQGRYLVDRTLGQGGMGAVYLVRDAHLSRRPCAMKELLDYSRSEQEREASVRRFLAEAETLASLSDPGIPQVYDRFVENGRYYLVMEFVAGVDLARIAAELGGPVPEADVVRWALQVCDVLSYLHDYDPPVVHRDLKPANMLVIRGGRVKLVDFGIARSAAGNRGTSLGTRGYAPPEQYRGELEPRSDLYALGASLHHLLSGRDPQQQAPFDFPPLATLVPGVNPALAALVARLLAMRPEARPDSAEAVRQELAAAYPGIDPYHARGFDPQVDELIVRLLEERLGPGAAHGRSGTIQTPPPLPSSAPVPAAGNTSPAPSPGTVAQPGPAAPLRPAGTTAPLAPPPVTPTGTVATPSATAGGTVPLADAAPPRPGITAPLTPPAPVAGTAPLALPACPICGSPAAPGQKFCTTCGVRISGPLPRLHVHGSSADLALRVPPQYWEKGRVERVTFVDDAGQPAGGIIISILPGTGAQYAFVTREHPAAPGAPPMVGAPVEVYLHERRGEEPVLTAVGSDRDRMAEAIRLWQQWLVS